MPVIPANLEPFKILPLSTLSDRGEPTKSVLNDAKRVFALIDDERHLVAHALYEDVKKRIESWESKKTSKPSSPSRMGRMLHLNRKGQHANKDEGEFVSARDLLEERSSCIEKLENRCRLFRKAQQNLNEESDWVFGSQHFGIKTYYRREENGSLSIKLEGEVKDVPLFEQVCVLKEVDLHYKWAPFCFSSLTIADIDKLDVVGWFLVGMPHFGMSRDGCFRAIGCDNIMEDDTIILAAQGVNDIKPGAPPPDDSYLCGDPIIKELDIPPVPKRRGSSRMTIRKFDALIKVTSPTSAVTKIVANVDPNLSFIPQSVLDFIMKHMAGAMLGKLQAAAKKVTLDPKKNVHAKRMREEADFYRDWLLVKFKAICIQRGWEMPSIRAFEFEDVAEDSRFPSSRNFHRSNTYSGTAEALTRQTELSETMSTYSNPDFHLAVEDEMSELTSRSGRSGATAWQNNPIASYLREMEQKTQRRKDQQIAEARRRAEARLKPKEFSLENQERLRELKTAKARRQKRTHVQQPEQSEGSERPPKEPSQSLLQNITARLHTHNRFTRMFVIASLVVLLFVMLHPETILRLYPIMKVDASDAWYISFLEDLLAVLYIFLCSLPHLLLCDIALVYAFSSLDIGMKSGAQVKQYYSERVRFAAALSSLGIVVLSIMKALVKVWTQVGVWRAVQLYGFAVETFSNVKEEVAAHLIWLPDLTEISRTLVWLVQGLAAIGRMTSAVWIFFLDSCIRSNFVGRDIQFLVQKSWALFLYLFGQLKFQCNEFVQDSIYGFESREAFSFMSWREEAFGTARSLFTYTAVFLLSTLFLFTVTSKGARAPDAPLSPRSVAEDVGMNGRKLIVNSPSNVSSISDGSSGNQKSPRTLPSQHTIPEEDVFVDTLDANRPVFDQFEGVSAVESPATAWERKRTDRLKFRAKNSRFGRRQRLNTADTY